MIPKPRINLLVYHGAFAPHARGRTDAVRRAHEGAAPTATVPASGETATDTANAVHGASPVSQPAAGVPAAPRPPPPRAGYVRPKYYAWASLLERTFAIDVLACPDCGGRLRFVATIEDRAVIEKILRHLELSLDLPAPAPARQADWLPGFDPTADWLPD